MEFVNKANQLFVEEQYESARDQYTKAVAKLLGKSQFPAMFGRAKANLRLEDYHSAVRDFGECISLNHTHQLTSFYLGLCLLKTGKHDLKQAQSAYKYLLMAKKGASKQARFDKELQKAIKLLEKLKPKVEISSQSINSATSDIEMKKAEQSNKADGAAPPPPTTAQQMSKPKLRESWYQNGTDINLTLYAKNLNRDDVSITFESEQVTIELQFPDGTQYTRRICLCHAISPEKCKFTLNKYKINVTLKTADGAKWKSLESVTDDGSDKVGFASPWTTKRNWSEVGEYASKELEKEKPEGDEALQSLFSKIYKDADDDQRRAMIKSFQTSGGTVLSTNWDEVKSKDYEGKDKVLPTGQNTAKYEY